MIFKRIRCAGFETIYNGFKEGIPQGRDYGSKVNSLLEHAYVSYELEDVPKNEVFYFKKFSSNVKIISVSYKNFLDEMDPLYKSVQNALVLHDEMMKDTDINKEESAIGNLLPIGTERYHIMVIFRGRAILNLTGFFLLDIFRDRTGKLAESMFSPEALEDIFASRLYKSFYEYILNDGTDIDILSDYMMHKDYYDIALAGEDSELLSISDITTPFGRIKFFNVNESDVNKAVSQVKGSILNTPYEFDEMVYMNFVVNSSFSLFFRLFLETSFVKDYINLKEVMAADYVAVNDEITDKYTSRINNAIDPIIRHKKEVITGTDMNSILRGYQYILNGNLVTYNISMSLSEAKGFIEKFSNLPIATESEMSNLLNMIQQFVDFCGSLLG